MPGPVAGFIQTPDDTSNAGKKVRTRTRVIGSDTVHHHVFERESRYKVLGVYSVSLGLASVQATAHDGTSTAFAWLFNPAASGVLVGIRRIQNTLSNSAATVAATCPRIAAQRFTYTGTASGSALTYCKHDSSAPTATSALRTAVTGATVTLAQIARSLMVPACMTAVGQFGLAADWRFDEDEDDRFLIAAGEGLCLLQKENGTTSDPRRFTCEVQLEEYDVA